MLLTSHCRVHVLISFSVPNGEVKTPPATTAVPSDRGAVVRGVVQNHVTPACRTASVAWQAFFWGGRGARRLGFRIGPQLDRGTQHRQQVGFAGFQPAQQVGSQGIFRGVNRKPAVAGQGKPDAVGFAFQQQVGRRAGHIVTRTRFVVSGCSKALPLFPELPLTGSPVELWELWERFSGFASANAAGFTS